MLTIPGRDAADAARDADFADIYRAHHRRVLRLAWLLTGDPDSAEDVVAEAFTNVWRQWERGRVDRVGPYLTRAVVNTARSRGRRLGLERRESVRRSGDERGVRLLDEDATDHDVVWGAVQDLPPGQRAALVLRYYEDLSVQDTAAVLNLSTGTVKSQVSRALDHLRRVLGPDAPGGGAR